LTRVDLLVLEDFGMKKLGASAAEDLLEIFVRRHEAGSTLITTNRPPPSLLVMTLRTDKDAVLAHG
jgi:DNA replication protein DnaC